MSQRTCSVAGCGRPTAGRYTRLCGKHRSHVNRHGHPLQRSIRATDLDPYVKVIAGLRKRDPDAPLWNLLEDRWEQLVRSADDTAKATPFKHQREAAKIVLTVAKDAEARKVVDTMLAVFMMRERDPRAFLTDLAFDYQLARRFRGLAPSYRGTYYHAETGRTAYVYRQTTPRAMKALARSLTGFFGVAGVKLCRRIDEAEQAEARAKAALGEAVDSLKITAAAPETRMTPVSLIIPVHEDPTT